MSPFLRVLPLVIVAGLAACSSNGPTLEAADRKPAPLPMAPVDEEAQRDKAVATRIAACIESLKANDPERARRHITRALELNPKSPEAHNAMALYYRYEGDDKREEEHYRKAISLNSGYSQARNNYASLLYRQARYKEAIRQLEKAVDDTNYDQRPLALLNLGRSYAKAGELDKAAAALERSLRLDSQQPDAILEMADVLFQQGKTRDAAGYLNAYAGRARHSARSLWLGIRAETANGNRDAVSSYELQLESMFKGSPEYNEWQAWKKSPAATNAGAQAGQGVSR